MRIYLKHQNKRDAYVKDFWNVVHWKEAGNNLGSFLKSQHGEWRNRLADSFCSNREQHES